MNTIRLIWTILTLGFLILMLVQIFKQHNIVTSLLFGVCTGICTVVTYPLYRKK